MILYEVKASGFFKPLSREQIAKFFFQGQLNRDTPCKAVATKGWRTVDELFPMLKYDSSVRYENDDGHSETDRDFLPWLFALGGILVAVGAFAVYFLSPLGRSIGDSSASKPIVARSYQPPLASPPITTSQGVEADAATPIRAQPTITAPKADLTSGARNEAIAQEQAYQERLQRQRDQAALAERMRNEQASADAADRASAGQDFHIPLDQNESIVMGGQSVTVRIHDNDVTSFDAWINGQHWREIKKEKGISHSGTDETLIYQSGNAALYYVWEISGKLNHCILRVRQGDFRIAP